ARPGRGIGERDRHVQADRRIHLSPRTDAGGQVETLHERGLKLPREAVVANLDRLLEDPLDVLAPTGFVDCRQTRMFGRRELLDVLARDEHPRGNVFPGLVEMLVERTDFARDTSSTREPETPPEKDR